DSALVSVQRIGVQGVRRVAAGGTGVVGRRGELQPSGRRVAHGHGAVLSGRRLAARRARHHRPAPGLPRPARTHRLGCRHRGTPRTRGSGAVDVNFEPAERVADAVLYEGYVLYPYRASAAKNQYRWQFGVLAPRTPRGDGEPAAARTECLIESVNQRKA